MNEKLSFQNISDTLARMSGVSKKSADTFSKAFFDTIVETLSTGEPVKIKGLGTFKLVEVEDRESVNVSTGKRFVIPGYKKVAFTAEDSVVEVLNGRAEGETRTEIPAATEKVENAVAEKVKAAEQREEPIEADVPVVVEEIVKVEEPQKAEDIDTLIQVPEPEQVEQPQDAFAGIDMLISTPESVEDIRQQYEEAKAKMETAVEEARKANAEKVRLEKLLERLEKNVEPEESAHTEEIKENPEKQQRLESEEVAPVVSTAHTAPSEEERRQEALRRVMTEQSHTEEETRTEQDENKKGFWLTILIVLLLAVLGVFVYFIHRNIEAVEKVQPIEQTTKPAKPATPEKPVKQEKPVKPAAPKVDKDSLAKAQKTDSIKAAKAVEVQKPERPATHRIQKGESLTRISQKYYGTKDSVRAILRVNTFADPDNIPVGAVVKLP